MQDSEFSVQESVKSLVVNQSPKINSSSTSSPKRGASSNNRSLVSDHYQREIQKCERLKDKALPHSDLAVDKKLNKSASSLISIVECDTPKHSKNTPRFEKFRPNMKN